MTILRSKFARTKLNIGKLAPSSEVNGPGKRFVIWLQGCNLHCPYCINQEFQSHDAKQIISVLELFDLIASIPNIEGVTYSGGEPFEQAEALYYLSKLLMKNGITIMSYSGYTKDELTRWNSNYVSGLLSTLDILIDGRFEIGNAAPLLWRGSRNQKIYFLTNKYKEYQRDVNLNNIDIECSVNDKQISLIGNINIDLINVIKDKLQENHGIILR